METHLDEIFPNKNPPTRSSCASPPPRAHVLEEVGSKIRPGVCVILSPV